MKNIKITSIVLGAAVIASFALSSIVLAEEGTSTETTVAATTTEAVVVTTATTSVAETTATGTRDGARQDLKNWIKDKRVEVKNDIKTKIGEFKDIRKASSSIASSTKHAEQVAKMEARKADLLKKQMDTVTQTLLNLSKKLGTLGTQIKAIVEGQASSTDAISQAVSKEEGRGGWDKFIFGADPKNLGVIISQVSIMQARVSQLDRQVSKMATSTDKTTAVASIQTLKDQIVTLEQYVKDNINKFSLFGWMRGWGKQN